MAEQKQGPQLDFNALVLSLGSSAIVHLGEAPDPTSGEKGKPDFPMAQQSIDLIAMLHHFIARQPPSAQVGQPGPLRA